MLAVALSLLFGLVAFAALLQIRSAAIDGLRRGRLIHAELAGRQKRGAANVSRGSWAKAGHLRPSLAGA